MNSIFTKDGQLEGVPVPLTSKEAHMYLMGDATLLDIRPEYETSLRSFDVPKVINISYNTYQEKIRAISGELSVIVADSVGIRSKEVALYLCSRGFSQVAYLSGGMVEWERAGLSIAKDAEYEMIGGCACRIHAQGVK